ncbi:MAG: FAD-binding protein, partial [Cyanobacteria bacterium P01_E01_bin.45]
MADFSASVISVSPTFAGHWDVAIVGSGAAGLYTALSFPSDWRILLVTKETLPTSSSSWAQGGIAAAIEPDDSPQLHAADTLRAGVGLCEPDAVQV